MNDITISFDEETPFFHVYRKIWDMKLTLHAKMVYFVLQDYANKSGKAFAKTETILERASIGKNSFFVALAELESKNIISRNFEPKYNRNNYTVKSPSYWIKPPCDPEDKSESVLRTTPETDQVSPYYGLPESVLRTTGVRITDSSPTFREKRIKKEPNKEFTCELDSPASQSPEDGVLFPEPEPQTTAKTSELAVASRKPPNRAEKALKKNTEHEDKGKTATEVWTAYCEAYGQRYKDKQGLPLAPPRSVRTATVCKNLMNTFGLDIAKALVRFLFTSKDSYIIRNHYSILGINDATWQSLYTQMMSGEKMTQTKAQQIDKTGALGDVAQRSMEKWAAIERATNEK